MGDRKFEITFDERLALRLMARAADTGQDLQKIVHNHLIGWLGDWGLSFAVHVVRQGETLSAIARTYYGDASKARVIAAFNDLQDPNLLRVGQVLRIPEAVAREPLPKGESPYLFGLHDRGGEYNMKWAGRHGWVLCTEEVGANPNDWHGKSYDDLAEAGFGVIVRLNHGYGARGTLPYSKFYREFATRCANFVERSSGCHIWIVGNEPNMAVERPGGPVHGEAITPQLYVQAYKAVREAIHSRPGHEKDQVITAAVAPWNIQTPYPENPSGDWIIYFQHMLELTEGELDGIALHTYGRDSNPANISSEACMDPPFDHRRKMFRTYIDFMEAIPASLRHVPVYITETDQDQAWEDANTGWIQEAYAEIDRWNSDPTHQKIRSLILYRWERYDHWYIRGKRGVISDFRDALRHDYRWRD